MKIIKREYLKKLISVIGTPDIKVITGVRRSGKSKLLEEFKEYILEKIEYCNIIEIDFNSLEYEDLQEYHKMNEYIEQKYIEGKKNFVLIDEVQMCNGFEKVINSLHASEKYDIYITGSNAFLLSSDLATLFTGRTYEIEIFPFSFKEYLKYNEEKNMNIDDAFDRYVREGGMSGAYLYKDEEQKYKYIKDICETLIVRDISDKYNLKNKELLNNLINFMMDNISNLTSIRNITSSLNTTYKINNTTVGVYLDYLVKSFLFYKIKRYDIEGKKYLESQDKYYLVDQGFKYAKIGTKNINYGRVYENIVAIELLRRGYEVYVGKTYKSEVDFVAMKRDEKIYIQVSDDITNEDTFKRETDSLLKIKDAYPKIIIARTKHDDYQYEGIKICDIAKWLAN